MIKLSNIKIDVKYGCEEPERQLAELLKIPGLRDLRILKSSVDARRKPEVYYVYTVAFSCADEKAVLKKYKNAEKYVPKEKYVFPAAVCNEKPIVIVGMGPAGLFAAYCLTEAGAKCILLEQGRDVDARSEDVSAFFATGVLDESSNVQFGEGGAGTFSDGKLTTGIKDPRVSFVHDIFVRFGAPKDIAYSAKPHIGTDILKDVIKNMRLYLMEKGCEVRFESRVTELLTENGQVTGCRVLSAADGEYSIFTDKIIFAPGNSARANYPMLKNAGVKIGCKSFSVGVRIEHLQGDIDIEQYGRAAFYGMLPSSDYKLVHHTSKGRGVYTFCVCPGGYVLAAASEARRVVTNGMSYRARDGININGALLVGVTPEDFSGDPDKAVQFVCDLESAAYRAGGGEFAAPCQTVGDFLKKKKTEEFYGVYPTYSRGVKMSNLWDILPKFICEALAEALPELGKKLPGFDDKYAVMTAVETRSSSPVQITRENMQSVTLKGLFPCGEGAGYAGGIVSAAVDGIRAAEAAAK